MLSIIIPALDEAKTINKTLTQLQKLKGDFEIIVVDGGSHDATRKIVEQHKITLIKAERGLPEQLTAGVLKAKSNKLFFLHADSFINQEGLDAIQALDDSVHAGGFLHRYNKFHLLGSLQATINNINSLLFRRFSGEQGLYITKDALSEVGGVPDVPVFETEELCRRLRRNGMYPQIISGRTISSIRRFERQGITHFLKLNWAHTLYGLRISHFRLKKHFPKVR